MAVHKKFNALGRGLDALISTEGVRTSGTSTISEVPLSQIEANPDQPRREFDGESLQELAASIREIGIIQPITLRQTAGDKYQIIAGERRWRASQMAGLEAIPAYIRTIKDENVMEMALVENIQREDLNAIEIALAYEHLMEESGMTQEKVSERVGKSRAAITNYLRLLKLPAQVQVALQKKEIDMGHARALLSVESPSMQIRLFNETQKNGYSVRRVEELARQIKQAQPAEDAPKPKGRQTAKLPDEYEAMRAGMEKALRSPVRLACSAKGKGSITIAFGSVGEMERLAALLGRIS